MSNIKSSTKYKLSIIVPVYNEIEIIDAFHSELVSCLQAMRMRYEIIYIDDNSTDGTYFWLEEQAKNNYEQRTKNKERKGDVLVFKKIGRKGKAYSLIEGFDRSRGGILVMIDGDLQYPPSAIAEMVKKLKKGDVVTADRQIKDLSLLRKISSKTFKYFFGNFLFGIDSDIQSGLKVFKREVWDLVKFTPASPWTFDLEFLNRSYHAGYKLQNYDINFSDRKEGHSKVKFINSTVEIGLNALLSKVRGLSPFIIFPKYKFSMKGAGIRYKNLKYITHTTLAYKDSAFKSFSNVQIIFLISLTAFTVMGFIAEPLLEARIIFTILSFLYFVDTIFNLSLILKSISKPVEVTFDDEKLMAIDDKSLPIYTIMCPLYREAELVPQFLSAISKLNWPAQKLDVMLLLEEDDPETISAVKRMTLPHYVRIIVVPDSLPKTKPKACNYGLAHAKGEYLVIYDAEDIPDPMQLKKAYLGFRTLPGNIRCLQAKLNYYNPGHNLLTRFFTAEYSLWFDLTLTGLQSLNSALPLGGTSNHFRTKDLIDLQGWDPFNVTEDADLGVRLFKKGYKTAIIDSTTLEEANSNLQNWLRQRSRWIKGYMQTYLVQMRDFRNYVKENGWRHALIFQLTIGGKLLFLLINPFMWVITFLYFAFYSHFAKVIELVFFAPVSYIAVFSLIGGNFLFLYYYMVACGKRNQWDLAKYIYLIPLYWAIMSRAAVTALYQLIFNPHYWEKTVHGFHLGRSTEVVAVSHGRRIPIFFPRYTFNRGKNIKIFDNFGKNITIGLYYILFLVGDISLIYLLYPKNISLPYIYFSVAGKSIYIISQLISFSTLPLFKKWFAQLYEKKGINYYVFVTFIISWLGVILFGFQAFPFFHNFLGVNTTAVGFELTSFNIAMMYFAMANVLVLFNLKKKLKTFLVLSYIVLGMDLLVLFFARPDLTHIIRMTVYLSGANVLLMFLLHLNKGYLRVFENNLGGIFQLLQTDTIRKSWEEKRMRILIFNWRDIKHNYAGGAEVYVHELAKRWVRQGNKVTLFCGNDNTNKTNDIVDGVEIVRRGGTYTTYLFAFIYYAFKFAGKYDLIIDCENGIPFFTPLFSRIPVILIIHHVHQEIIRKYLRFPLNKIAAMLEGKLMPLIYRNKKIVTVSDSSKEEIMKLGFTEGNNIEIVYNGTSVKNSIVTSKTPSPTFLYLGRLQDYKNIDIAIAAFANVVKQYKNARFKIVGSGESHNKLVKQVNAMGIKDRVDFLGKVGNKEKIRLLTEAWAVIQPSQIEGWGITVIEANACGTPVIASRVNGLRDSVVDGKTGILVESGNIELFARAMKRLIRDAQLRNYLSREAYIWSKNFSWHKSANIFYNLIGKSLPAYTAKVVNAPTAAAA